MLKVLIVDDSIFSQKIVANSLKKAMGEIEISFAENGEEGFIKYKELKPDFVVLDLLMPKINGQELIFLIKKYDEKAKLFVVSADVQKNVRDEVENNILAFINKPFTVEKANLISELLKENLNE